MVVLILVIVFFVVFLICGIGILILSAIPMILDSIAEIKEKWRELKGKGKVE
jgi:hypothetical protein